MAAVPPTQEPLELLPMSPATGERRAASLRVPILTAAALVTALLFIVPIGSILVSPFLESEGTWQHLAETVLPGYIANTVILVLGVGFGVLVIGVSTAWLVTMCRFPGVRLFEWALVLPLAVPAYVMAYSYTDFLQFAGPLQTALRAATGWEAGDYWFPNVRSIEGAMLMLIMVLYPYVYLLTRAALIEQSICILEVSRTLGCTAWRSFWQVALPTARPAIVAGTALALMETLADYGTVAFFGLPTFTTASSAPGSPSAIRSPRPSWPRPCSAASCWSCCSSDGAAAPHASIRPLRSSRDCRATASGAGGRSERSWPACCRSRSASSCRA